MHATFEAKRPRIWLEIWEVIVRSCWKLWELLVRTSVALTFQIASIIIAPSLDQARFN